MSRRRQKSYRNNSDKYNDRRKRSPKREVAKGVMYNRNQRQKIEQKRERQRQYKRGSRHKAILSRRHFSLECHSDHQNQPFRSKMAKCKGLKTPNEALPSTSSQKIEITLALLRSLTAAVCRTTKSVFVRSSTRRHETLYNSDKAKKE
jgi:hypothetical protein